MSKPLSFWGANFHIFFPEKYDFDTCKEFCEKKNTLTYQKFYKKKIKSKFHIFTIGSNK
jgi:hypothetical protein